MTAATDWSRMCPGAMLRVTRHDARELQAGGERFRSGGTIPVDGYGDMRVACDREAERLPGGYVAGLCASCNSLEEDNRAMLRARQGK